MSDALAVARALNALHHGVCVPNYELALAQAYHRFLWRTPPADLVILDVGAHTGLHLGHFAKLAQNKGRVIAFEPIPKFASGLVSQFPSVEVRQMALGRYAGLTSFHYLPENPEMSGLQLRTTDRPSAVQTIQVRMDTLDRQVADLKHLTYMKVDTEGAEIDCLLGGERTIARLRPIISVEYGEPSYSAYEHTAISLFNTARYLAYVLSDLFGNLIETEADWLAICDTAYWDYFLVPRERLGEWRTYFAN